MKISVILEKKSRVSVDVPTGQANELFKKLATMVIDGGCETTSQVSVPNIKLNQDFKQKFAEISHEIGRTLSEAKPVVKEFEEKAEQIPGKKHLIMVKCESCGKVATPIMYIENGELIHKEHNLVCMNCSSELPQFENIKYAKYTCPNCNTRAGFYVANDLNEVRCKDCDSPIDLVWHDKKKVFLSANLIEGERE